MRTTSSRFAFGEQGGGGVALRASIIIPTLDESGNIERTLKALSPCPEDVEIIVVDGGSHDGTVELAQKCVRVLTSKPGRALQMNWGAQHAQGKILFFLHADTILTTELVQKALKVLEADSHHCAVFRLKFDHPHPLLRFFAFFTRFRWGWTCFGDQVIVVKREVFERAGGFSPIPILEDVEFLRRMRRWGRLIRISDPVITSSRRFLKRGILRQQLINAWIYFAFCLGVAPEILKRWYEGKGE